MGARANLGLKAEAICHRAFGAKRAFPYQATPPPQAANSYGEPGRCCARLAVSSAAATREAFSDHT